MQTRKEDWHEIFIVVKGRGARMRVALHTQGLAWIECLLLTLKERAPRLSYQLAQMRISRAGGKLRGVSSQTLKVELDSLLQ